MIFIFQDSLLYCPLFFLPSLWTFFELPRLGYGKQFKTVFFLSYLTPFMCLLHLRLRLVWVFKYLLLASPFIWNSLILSYSLHRFFLIKDILEILENSEVAFCRVEFQIAFYLFEISVYFRFTYYLISTLLCVSTTFFMSYYAFVHYCCFNLNCSVYFHFIPNLKLHYKL